MGAHSPSQMHRRPRAHLRSPDQLRQVHRMWRRPGCAAGGGRPTRATGTKQCSLQGWRPQAGALRSREPASAITAGVARSVRSQRRRHAGRRLNAKARTNGVRSNAAAVTPDSILCAEECQEVLSQPASMPWQSSRNSPSRNMPAPTTATPRTPTRARKPTPECGPQTNSEAENEDAGEVRGDLVVKPWARSCESARDR